MKLPKGKHLESKNLSDLSRIKNPRRSEFQGALRFRAKSGDAVYFADLLVDESTIVAASLRTNEEIFISDKGLRELGDRVFYSKGKIDVFSFDKSEMKRAVSSNKSALLSVGVPTNEFEVKYEGKRKKLFEIGPLSARFSLGLKGMLKQGGGAKKSGRYSMGEVAPKIMKKYGIEYKHSEDKKDAVSGGKRVQTNIDKLYEILQDKNTLKVSDALAKKLNVTKRQIIGWAEILEKHGMVELHYSTMGQTEIRMVDKKT